MSANRIVGLIAQLILAILIIFYGAYMAIQQHGVSADEPFSKYQSMEDCIQQNYGKRDPEQYCKAIRRKVRSARRRKYGKNVQTNP